MAPEFNRRGYFLRGSLPLLALLFQAGCQRPPPQSEYRVAVVGRRDIAVTALAAGVVEPITTIEVKSKASGEIIAVLVEEGDAVKEGQLLVKVDPRIPTNAMVQAEADSVVARAEFDNAEAQLARSEQLHQSAAITDLELENARLARASAYAALIRTRRSLEDAKIALEDTEVRAPAPGVVLGRSVEVGTVIASASQNVSGGTTLLRMATLDTVRVRALVDETDIGMITPRMPVSIQVAAYPNRPFQGAVERIGVESVAQQNVTMFPVLIRIANAERLLRPGMNAEVQVHIGELHNTLALPSGALRMPADALEAARLLDLPLDGLSLEPEGIGPAPEDSAQRRRRSLFGGEFVAFALRHGRPQAVLVRTGLTDFDYTAVLEGLAEGDSVLLLPTTGLIAEQQQREDWARRRAGGPLQSGGTR